MLLFLHLARVSLFPVSAPLPVAHRAPIQTEVTIINTNTNRVDERKTFQSAHIMESIEFTPQGDMAIATLVRPKNNVPSAQIEGGWMINHGIGIIMKDGRMAQLLFDEPNAFYPDPYNVVIHPNGKFAYVSHSGADIISVIDLDAIRSLLQNASESDLVRYANHLGLSSQYVVKRIKTGSNPKGMAISPDGKYVYVVERMMDRISVIDTEKMEIDHNIHLAVRRGSLSAVMADSYFTMQAIHITTSTVAIHAIRMAMKTA